MDKDISKSNISSSSDLEDVPIAANSYSSSDALFEGGGIEADTLPDNYNTTDKSKTKESKFKSWFKHKESTEEILLKSKKRFGSHQQEDESALKDTPEPTAFFFSRWTYSWLDPLLRSGFRAPLESNDMYRLDERFLAEPLANQFEKEWQSELLKEKENPKYQARIVHILYRMFGRRFALAGILKFLSDTCQLGSPIVAMYLIAFIESFQDGSEPWDQWIGWFLLALLLVLQLLGTLFLNYYFLICMWTGLRVRGTLVSVVYRKTLRLDDAARQNFTNGKIVNIVSTDISRMDSLASYLHVIWSAPFQLVVVVALLVWQLGVAAVVGLAIILILVPVQGKIISSLVGLRKQNAKLTDSRIRQISEVLSGIRVIKFFAWEKHFQSSVSKTRAEESSKIKKLNVLRNLTFAIAMGTPVLAMAISFVIYSVLKHNIMSPAAVFGSLSYYNLLRFPMMMLPMVISQAADCSVAIKRLTALLKGSEIRQVMELTESDSFGLKITDATFQWEVSMAEKAQLSTEKSTDLLLNKKKKTTASKQSSLESISEVDETLSTLSKVNLTVPKGKLTAVVGSVGSGKSSLLNAIIGEMKCLNGRVQVCGSIGYTAQQAWIMNATLRENITFGQPFDPQRYKQVVKDCALEPDFAMLPHGDATEIGERGINLSGGQKQRVSLARCVYLDRDIVLLDDPLSAVDAHVGKYLFDNCILGSLKNKTRVLVTHQLHFLSRADYIVVMEAGNIIETGSFKQLMEKRGVFDRLMTLYGGQEDHKPEDSELGSNKAVHANALAAEKTGDDAVKADSGKDKLMMSEERAKGSVEWEVYKSYFRATGGYWFVGSMLLFLAVGQALRVLTDMWLVWWVTPIYVGATQVGSGKFGDLSQGGYIGIYITLAVLQVFSTFVFGILFCFAGYWASVFLHKEALARLFRAPVSFFDCTPLGRILNRFSKDTDAMDNTLPDSLRMFVSTFGSALATLILIMIATPFFGVPLVPLLCVYGFVQLLYRRSSREVKRLEAIGRSPLYAHFSESMSGLPTIRAYSEQQRFQHLNEEIMDSANRPYYIQIVLQRWLGLRLETIGGFLVFFSGLFGIVARSSINPGLIGLALSYVLQITSTLNWCVRQFTETEIQMNSVERIDYYVSDLQVEAPAVIPDRRPSKYWPTEGRVVFQNVSMRYLPHLPLTLQGISFSIGANEKIGIVGRTGAGKSSILNALFRMVELAEGAIYIDDINVSEIGLADLRCRLGIIPQDPVLFQGTVRSNLDPTLESYTESEMWEALAKANLKDVVSATSGKLDAAIADGGENWSVGQRQLFCLARAMLKKPRICILDEATANVDFETDAIIQKALRVAFKESTIITIAHRVNTIIDYDRVLVLGHGRILEFDSPAKLLENEKSHFFKMVMETGERNAKFLIQLARNKDSVKVEELLKLGSES